MLASRRAWACVAVACAWLATGERFHMKHKKATTVSARERGTPPVHISTGAVENCASLEKWKAGVFTWNYFKCKECVKGAVLLPGPPPGLSSAELKKENVEVQTHCSLLDDSVEGKMVLLIRHGQSMWNKVTEKRGFVAQAVGWTDEYEDSPLSGEGLRQAQRLASALRKADEGAAPEPTNDDPLTRTAAFKAVEELEYSDLEQLAQINENGKPLEDAALVERLHEHKEELEVLVGRKCDETSFVTSQLARAMDTFNIVMLQARLNCDKSFEISSNLQEFEHNADCTPKTKPGHKPQVDPKQQLQYIQDQMEETLAYIKQQYHLSDVKRFTKNLGTSERSRLPGAGNTALFKETIKNELANILGLDNLKKRYTVIGGHSIWFRELFKHFGDQASETCRQLGDNNVKIANAGVAAMTLRKVKDANTPYVAVDCKWIHLGPHKAYTYKFSTTAFSSVVPAAKDFNWGAKIIVGWKCCCSSWGCVRARGLDLDDTHKCGDTRTWAMVADQPWPEFKKEAANYRWESRFGVDWPCVEGPRYQQPTSASAPADVDADAQIDAQVDINWNYVPVPKN